MAPSPVNYYDLLQISPHAGIDTIERVYRILACRYGPENSATEDPERFVMLTEAYRVLSDPLSRTRYDRTLGRVRRRRWRIPRARIHRRHRCRSEDPHGRACLLYSKRRANPDFAALSLLDMENLMAFPREKLLFAIWYLKSKRYIVQDERSSFTATADGVDFVDSQLPANQMLYKIFRASEAGVMVYPKQLSSKPQ